MPLLQRGSSDGLPSLTPSSTSSTGDDGLLSPTGKTQQEIIMDDNKNSENNNSEIEKLISNSTTPNNGNDSTGNDRNYSEMEKLISTLSDDIEKLKKENDDLKKHFDKEIIQLSTTVQSNQLEIEHKAVSALDSMDHLPRDSYSFLYYCKVGSKAWSIGLLTFCIQLIIFGMFLFDQLETASIPPNVEIFVRVTQVLAILVSFLIQSEVRVALTALIYQNGLDALLAQQQQQSQQGGVVFCTQDGGGGGNFQPCAYFVAYSLMLSQGILGQVVVLLLIFYSDNIIELILNFSAVEFISKLDDIAFLLAAEGYFGNQLERVATKIKQVRYHEKVPSTWKSVLRTLIYLTCVIGSFVAFGFIVEKQISYELLPQTIKVEFADPANPIMGTHSGCYRIEANHGINSRVEYIAEQPGRRDGKFLFCDDSWAFAANDNVNVTAATTTQNNDNVNNRGEVGCSENLVWSREERPSSFNILDSIKDQWVLSTGSPIGTFLMSEVDDDDFERDCRNFIFDDDGGPCTDLVVGVEQHGFFSDLTSTFSREFTLFSSSSDGRSTQDFIRFYQHPVYKGATSEYIFFTGRKWMFLEDKDKNVTHMESLFGVNRSSALDELLGVNQSVLFMTEDVDAASDQGTPLGLRWFHAQQGTRVNFPFADTSRPSDTILVCGQCSNSTNPCLYDGVCINGECQCEHGTEGKLCEILPLGDGVCNPLFNTESFNYDEGDCCAATCTSKSLTCGVGDLKSAFDQDLASEGTPIGFPFCSDPSMVKLTVEIRDWYVSSDDGPNGDDGTYDVEFFCNENTIVLQVSIDASTRNASQIIEVQDGSTCELRVTNFEAMIYFRIFDGPNNDGISLKMNEEKAVFTDSSDDEHVISVQLYPKCLKQALAPKFVNQSLFYTSTHLDYQKDSYQDKAVSRLVTDILQGNNWCENPTLPERYALLAMAFGSDMSWNWIEDMTSGDHISSPWIEEMGAHCRWLGVSCDNGFVTKLGTEDFNYIPTEIGLLTHLRELDWSFNHDVTRIPIELGWLTGLQRLTISTNSFYGKIPTELDMLSSLQRLTISTNSFYGKIPTELGMLSSLQELSMGWNRLTGTIPSHFGLLSNLTHLELSRNNITGTIPSHLGQQPQLTHLDLSSNNLNGTIPSHLGQLSQLTLLDLSSNDLTGTIPNEFQNLDSLEELYLPSNLLAGPIPDGFGCPICNENLLASELQCDGSDVEVVICLRIGASHYISWELQEDLPGVAQVSGGNYSSSENFITERHCVSTETCLFTIHKEDTGGVDNFGLARICPFSIARNGTIYNSGPLDFNFNTINFC